MIKLDLPPKPIQLTAELQSRLTQEYKDTGKTVWKIDWLKIAVSDMSFGKCCFSEIRLGEESKYMEIEHFHSKRRYPDEVMEWGNLMPSCKKCNGTKLEHDTLNEPIVNPFVDNPKDYLFFKNYRYYPKNKNEIGHRTIDVLGLNDHNHFVSPRFKIGNEIIERLQDFKEIIQNLEDARKRIRFISRLKNLLELGNRKEEYAALVSTTILLDENFNDIKEILKLKGIWDDEFESLTTELEFCALLED
jgi:hypothetical protein